ncbi:MAG: thiamine diphosphokinase [bacterium]|nr:thiamine diphosphokinase [bacterium]
MNENARIASLLPPRFDAVLVAGGDRPRRVLMDIAVARAARVVALDGGLRHLRALGVAPQVVIGDLDSALPADITWARRRRAHVLLRAEQDSSDMDKALRLCRERGWRNVAIASADGLRADHFLHGLSRAAALRGLRITFLLKQGLAFPLSGRMRLVLPIGAGRTFSWFGLPEAQGASLTGAQWPLRNKSLVLGDLQSLSNRATVDSVTVAQQSGRSVIIIPIGKA